MYGKDNKPDQRAVDTKDKKRKKPNKRAKQLKKQRQHKENVRANNNKADPRGVTQLEESADLASGWPNDSRPQGREEGPLNLPGSESVRAHSNPLLPQKQVNKDLPQEENTYEANYNVVIAQLNTRNKGHRKPRYLVVDTGAEAHVCGDSNLVPHMTNVREVQGQKVMMNSHQLSSSDTHW